MPPRIHELGSHRPALEPHGHGDRQGSMRHERLVQARAICSLKFIVRNSFAGARVERLYAARAGIARIKAISQTSKTLPATARAAITRTRISALDSPKSLRAMSSRPAGSTCTRRSYDDQRPRRFLNIGALVGTYRCITAAASELATGTWFAAGLIGTAPESYYRCYGQSLSFRPLMVGAMNLKLRIHSGASSVKDTVMTQ